jgi:peptidoglycan LD-endopeptidase LytH
MLKSARARVLLFLVIFFAVVLAATWFFQKRFQRTSDVAAIGNSSADNTNSASSPQPTPTATLSPEISPTPSISPSVALSPSPSATTSEQPSPAIGFVGRLKLIVPVQGVRPDQLLDTFADARSEGRVHDAIDIPAASGTPVIAATDGQIVKLFQSERGGTTIYQLSNDQKLIFYYAHLQRYADGLSEGKFVRQGEVIGYVGDTGNAGAGNYHLHFSIAIATDPKRWWEGTNINPYPLLRE